MHCDADKILCFRVIMRKLNCWATWNVQLCTLKSSSNCSNNRIHNISNTWKECESLLNIMNHRLLFTGKVCSVLFFTTPSLWCQPACRAFQPLNRRRYHTYSYLVFEMCVIHRRIRFVTFDDNYHINIWSEIWVFGISGSGRSATYI